VTLGSEYLGFSVRVATVVVPVAVYFLILGLLNSRRHPQLLTSRQDFALLVTALSPLFVAPAMSVAGGSLTIVLLVGAALAGVVVLGGGGRGSWVIYNLPAEEARRTIASIFEEMGLSPRSERGGFRLPTVDAFAEVGGFRLLRNVSVRLRGGSEALAKDFQSRLTESLATVRAETSPMAVSMLLVATAMLVAPVTLVAHRAGEIVRLLTDLLP